MFSLKNLKVILFISLISMLLNSCSSLPGSDARKFPPDPRERVKQNIEQGKGFRLMDKVGKGGSGTFEFASSNELWRASLDTIDFMPLTSANYSGGIIITDWYSENENTGESIKLIIRFLTNEVRSDAIDLKIYYRKCSSGNNCKITKRTSNLGVELKKEILKLATIYKKEANNKKSKRSKIGKNQYKEN